MERCLFGTFHRNFVQRTILLVSHRMKRKKALWSTLLKQTRYFYRKKIVFYLFDEFGTDTYVGRIEIVDNFLYHSKRAIF